MAKPRVILADDHRIFLDGLNRLLEVDFDVVEMVEDGHALVEAALRLTPEIIIADISMPLLNGIDAIRKLFQEGLHAKVIFLTMQSDVMYAKEVFDMGASAYVLKHSASTELLYAIREALSGNTYICPAIANDLLQFCSNKNSAKSVFSELSMRQREVLQLLAEGKSAKEAAHTLKITPRTVEFHKYAIMQQLNINSSAELVQYAIKHGVISI